MNQEILKIFSVRLSGARARRGLSQSELATVLHVSPAAVGNWESAKNLPNKRTLRKLQETLGVSIDWLLGGEGRPDFSSRPRESAAVSSAALDLVRDVLEAVAKYHERCQGGGVLPRDKTLDPFDNEKWEIPENQSLNEAEVNYSASDVADRHSREISPGKGHTPVASTPAPSAGGPPAPLPRHPRG